MRLNLNLHFGQSFGLELGPGVQRILEFQPSKTHLKTVQKPYDFYQFEVEHGGARVETQQESVTHLFNLPFACKL